MTRFDDDRDYWRPELAEGHATAATDRAALECAVCGGLADTGRIVTSPDGEEAGLCSDCAPSWDAWQGCAMDAERLTREQV